MTYTQCTHCGTDNLDDGGLTRLCANCAAPLPGFMDAGAPVAKFSLSAAAVADAYPIFGVDISEFNGCWDIDKTIAEGASFAIIRGGFGNKYVDLRYPENTAKAKAKKFPHAVYHVSNPSGDWARQAAFALSLAVGAPMGLFMDDELTGGLSNDALGGWLSKYTARIDEQAIGRIYTRASWWNAYVPRCDWAKAHDLWVANYTSAAAPLLPNDWVAIKNPKTWVLWQWSADGNGQGAKFGVESAAIDLNRFHGDAQAFKDAFDVAPATPPVVPPEPPIDPPPAITPIKALGTFKPVVNMNPRGLPSTAGQDFGVIVKGSQLPVVERLSDGWARVEFWIKEK